MKQEFWGMTRAGDAASRYILENQQGMVVELSDFGALILSIRLPVNAESRDVVLGYDTLEEYYDNAAGFGAYVGRNGNRIGGAKVTIGTVEYALEQNDNGNNLHSGSDRSYYKFYAARTGEQWVEFSRVSPHMEQGFPGNLKQTIRYTLTEENALVIDYRLEADQTTVINPTNHCYFNLDGHDSGTVLEHTMQIAAEYFLPTDRELIPTGELRSVEGTPFDFRTPKRVGAEIEAEDEALVTAGGYDHNFCLKGGRAAWLESGDGRLAMTVCTDLEGMQVYSGNFLAGERGKNAAVYHRRSGICFETQHYPNACNEPKFPTSIVPGGEVFQSRTIYAFQVCGEA